MSNTSTRVERAQKPRKCPECGQAPLASILYGMPAFDEELERKMNEGRITLGGCCISDDDPAWECTRCGLKIFRRQVQ
jgi:DNA-directed RNA polymerase subunit RPC12/RpoP